MKQLLCLLALFLFVHTAWAEPAVPTDPTSPTAGPTTRVSLRTGGEQANNNSDNPAISADGRYAAFSSDANNLVSGDVNGKRDIFLHDRNTGVTTRVSLRTGGGEANGDSYSPVISDDGRIIVFYSLANNLVDGDTNNRTDIFAHDRLSGQLTLVSRVLSGTTNGDSRDPDISADGRFVTFVSSASNLVGGDNNFKDDVFRFDRQAQVMERISVASNGSEANDHSFAPAISGDGQRIVFVSRATNLIVGDGNNVPDIFLRNLSNGSTDRVNVRDGSNQANADSWNPDISANGRFVVFISLATNLVDGDTNNYPDVFLRDLNSHHVERVNIPSGGGQANNWSDVPTISTDGRFVAFESDASNLVGGDVASSTDIFIRDRQQSTTVRASINSDGSTANFSSLKAHLAANGRFIIFASDAINLVANDSNAKRDIFVHDSQPPPPPRPPATAVINYTTGAPGSVFTITGQYWLESQTYQVWVNGYAIGQAVADAAGNIQANLLTTPATDAGLYAVTIIQGATQRTLYFTLSPSAPLRTGPTGGFAVPDGIAMTPQAYLPALRR